MESAYAELNKQLGASLESGERRDAAQNARMKEMKVELEKYAGSDASINGCWEFRGG